MANDFLFYSATQTAGLIRLRQVSAMELVNALLEQIQRHNPTLNAIVTLDEEGALRKAKEADEALARGEIWGPLHGIPVTLKDLHDTAGIRTSFGNPHHLDHIPSEDSTVAARLKAAGAILLGKTNVELFPDNPFGETRNPWATDRSGAGSSNGAAAALAAGMSYLDVGSDAGGSITVPAHNMGVWGMRPTENRIPFNFFVDQVKRWHVALVVGPMARTAEDLRMSMSLLAGPDGKDAMIPPVPIQEEPLRYLQDLRIAWVSQFLDSPTSAAIRSAIEKFASQLQQLGARVEQAVPNIDLREQMELGGNLMTTIFSAFREEDPPLLKDYLKALHDRNTLVTVWNRFFEEWDVLLCPPYFRTAPLHSGEDFLMVDGQEITGDELVMASTLFTYTGHPSVVMPLSTDRNGLPIGVQLVGQRWQDTRLLKIAEHLSTVAGGFRRPPGY